MTTDIPMVAEVDCSTGIQTIRPMTPDEIKNHEALKAETAKLQAEREAAEKAQAELKASAIAKLAKLGLTEEEAKTIVI